MPPIVAPVSVPVTPSSFSAHSQVATAAESKPASGSANGSAGGFAAILHERIPHGQNFGKQAAAPKNASSNKEAKTLTESQEQTQAGIDAATATATNNIQAILAPMFAADPQLAAFSGEFDQKATDASSGSFAGLDKAGLQAALNLAADGQSGQAAENVETDIIFLEKLLPQLTESKSVAAQPLPSQDVNQEGFLMSELRQLVESHDSQATVDFSHGERASLNDIRTPAIRESAPQTVNIAPPAVTEVETVSIAIVGETAAENLVAPVTTKAAHTLAMPAPALTNDAKDDHGPRLLTPKEPDAIAGVAEKRESGESETEPKTDGQTPQASDRGQTATNDNTPPFGQAMAATAATATDSIVRPGQMPPVAGMALMQQVIDHIRDLPHPLPNRISLQLHPPELGELKINLTMKEGMIRASIVTQTVHAQEILEKNMPKLRALLEERGLVLDDVRIDQDGIFVINPAFFDNGQFSRQAHGNWAGGKRAANDGDGNDAGFAQALEQADRDNQVSRHNLNIQA